MQKSLLGTVALAASIGLFAPATYAAPLVFTLDLTAPCSAGNCGSAVRPTDIGLQLGANSFNYAVGTGSQTGSFLTQIAAQSPVVCDEVQSNGTLGPVTTTRLETDFANATPGGLLEFNTGGASIVDLGAFSYDGTSPAGVAASYSNFNAPQVVCYPINPVTGGAAVATAGPGGIFGSGFENHRAGEPWVSVQTVGSPTQIGHTLGYVVQIHNAFAGIGWHLDFGYDTAFFGPLSNGGFAPSWSKLSPGTLQPGPVGTPASPQSFNTVYTLASGDIQTSTNSVYLYVSQPGSSASVNNWTSLTSAFYPASASIFPPFGTYPQRLDDKSAVAAGSNLPTQNIGNIVCNNDITSTQCTLYDADGNAGNPSLPVQFTNSISSGGAVSVDPIVYFADPTSSSTAPGNISADALNPSNVSCNDPSGILASPLTSSSFTTSPSALGGLALGFGFATSGALYVSGTATCTATFTNTGYAPNLSSTFSFSITMLQTVATHFSVSAPASSTAGGAFNFTVSALDSGNNVVPSYNGTVTFAAPSDNGIQKSLPANSTLTNGTGTFSATLVTAGNQTITATDTVQSAITGTSGAIAVSPAAAAGFAVQALSPQTHGQQFQIQVTAQDTYGNTATGYTGTVHFTSTDSGAVLPADQTLTSGVASPLPYVTLNTTGTQTVTATDTATSSITGTSNPITVN